MVSPLFFLFGKGINNIHSVHGVHIRAPEGQERGRQLADHVHYPRFVFSRALRNVDELFLGGKELEEIELTHLDGHKGSKPVR
jgi:hypothetical protein